MERENPRRGNSAGSGIHLADDGSNHTFEQHFLEDVCGELPRYQALRLINLHAVRPELAIMLVALAFGGGQA